MMTGQSLLEKKVAQLFMLGLPSKTLEAEHSALLKKIGVGGVILFRHNFESLDSLIELTNSIQSIALTHSFEGLPSWIAVDQEGGRVKRFSEPFTDFPPQSKWGELNSPKSVFEAAYVIATELRACGVNVNFAPVVDVPAALDQSAIGDRAFSIDAEVVANMGSAAVRGFQKGGVMAVPKHFPGHGAVLEDSHAELPQCMRTAEELDEHEWLPFKRVVRSRCEGVMTAHILYPNIDPERPATLSRRLLQDHLRKNLRFSKLIFSDDLEMGALRKKYSLKDSAFLALEAGCDQILICHEWEKVEEIWQYLVKAFDSGALPFQKLEESLARIRDAKSRLLMPYRESLLPLAQAIVGAPDFKKVSQSIKDSKVLSEYPSASVK